MVTFFLTLLSQLRIHHWQTESYAQHMAYGNTYDALGPLIDNYIEIFMGKRGKIKNENGFSFKLQNYSESTEFIDSSIKYLYDELDVNDNDTDLMNIRDEIVSELNKLKYLLTLK